MSRSSNPSLLIVVTEDWYFLSHRLALARAATAAGLRVTVATGPGQLGAEIRAAGVEHAVFPLDRRSLRPWTEVATIAALVRIMRETAPDLVHLVAAKPLVHGNIAARFAGNPPVLNAIAGLGYLYLGGGVGRRVLRATYENVFRLLVRPRGTARVLVQNPDDAAFLLRRRMARPDQIVQAVGSGVDVTEFVPSPEPEVPPIVVLMHGRMLRDKGVGELVAAARLLVARGAPPFLVRLIGDPDPANPASIRESELNAWTSQAPVEWLGRRDDIPEQLKRCHIACLPSYREGAPLSLLEAAAAGRPIVTTDVPGCREVVRDGDNGVLVPVRDPDRLADALMRLFTDPALRRRLGARGRERAEREFSQDVINARILSTYWEMISAEGRA